MSKSLVKKLAEIQQKLKAPKGQFNKFGNYAYRSCEDILEAVKPLLGDLVLTVNDELVAIGEGEAARFYVKATAKITDGEHTVENAAFAREAADKKGMDDAQITGSASSYARKYALNGLFLIDDTKDADATNDHGKGEKAKPAARQKTEPKEEAPIRKKAEAKEERDTEEPKSTADSGNSFRRRRRG